MSEEKVTEEQELENNNAEAQEEATADEQSTEAKEEKVETPSPEEIAAAANDKYMRLYSEFENFRRRTAKERLDLIATASEDLVRELLPVMDDFDRAIKTNEESSDIEALREGVKLVFQKLSSTLKNQGVQEMDSFGKEFNIDEHEALTKIPAPSDDMKGKVVDVIEKGYKMKDKVIRYAKVVVGE